MKPSVHPSNKRARNKALREAKQARAKQRVDAVAENIRLRDENAQLRAFCASSGLCLCQSMVEDPGPNHLASCPNSDPDYVPEGFMPDEPAVNVASGDDDSEWRLS